LFIFEQQTISAMLRTIIIDDEENIRILLRGILSANFPLVKIVAEAGSVAEAYQAINLHKPELVLLDIRLGDGTGFGLLEKFDKIDFRIIFVTSYEEYALKALKLSAVDYIMKPVIAEELITAIEKARRIIREVDDQHIKVLIDNSRLNSQHDKKIVLKTADKFHFVPVSDIIRCESDSSYTKFFLADNSSILISRTLKEFEDILTGFGFFRPFKSDLINMKHIKAFDKTDGGFIIMTDNSRVPISDRKREEFFRLMEGL
jgi:two-component system, LytTR family, response regulator